MSNNHNVLNAAKTNSRFESASYVPSFLSKKRGLKLNYIVAQYLFICFSAMFRCMMVLCNMVHPVSLDLMLLRNLCDAWSAIGRLMPVLCSSAKVAIKLYIWLDVELDWFRGANCIPET